MAAKHRPAGMRGMRGAASRDPLAVTPEFRARICGTAEASQGSARAPKPPSTTGSRAQHVRLEDLFQNLGLGLPFQFGPRQSRCPEIWDPLSPHSKVPLVWIKNGDAWFCSPDSPLGC